MLPITVYDKDKPLFKFQTSNNMLELYISETEFKKYYFPYSTSKIESIKTWFFNRTKNNMSSLEDNLWIKFEDDNIISSWKNENLFNYKFKGILSYNFKSLLDSDLYWFRNNLDVIKVLDTRYSCECEVLATTIANKLGFDVCNCYLDFNKELNKVVSIRDLYTSEDISYINAEQYFNSFKTKPKNIFETDLYSKFQNKINDMLFLDCLLFNNRNLYDWGILINNNTRELIDIAPLHNFNKSLWYKQPITDIKDSYDLLIVDDKFDINHFKTQILPTYNELLKYLQYLINNNLINASIISDYGKYNVIMMYLQKRINFLLRF